jgi:exosortase/archaeosortase family protein
VPGLSAGTGLLAAGAALLALRRIPPGAIADPLDWACFAAALALAAAPPRAGAAAALVLLALPCLRHGAAAQGAAVLLLAAGAVGLFDLFGSGVLAAPVMAAEARVVVALLHAAGLAAEAAGNLVALPESRHALVILRGCSALVLLPEMLVLTLALAQLLRPLPGRQGWDAVALGLGMALLLNLLRLVAMAVSVPLAETLHSDAGLAGLQLLWTALALLAALVA